MRPGEASLFSKLVRGRDVQTVNALNLLWTVYGQYDPCCSIVTINHFVPLFALSDVFVAIEGQRADACSEQMDTAGEQGEVSEDGDEREVSKAQSETTLPIANSRSLHRDFSSLQACVAYLTDETLSDFVVDEVPAGVKENTWFLVRRHVTADDQEVTSCGTTAAPGPSITDGGAIICGTV